MRPRPLSYLRPRCLAECEGIAGLAGELHPHRLDLGVLPKGLQPVLPADTAMLVTAEGRVEGDGTLLPPGRGCN